METDIIIGFSWNEACTIVRGLLEYVNTPGRAERNRESVFTVLRNTRRGTVAIGIGKLDKLEPPVADNSTWTSSDTTLAVPLNASSSNVPFDNPQPLASRSGAACAEVAEVQVT